MSGPVSFRFPDGLVERIDGVRGDVPRTRWVVRALEAALSRVELAERSVRSDNGLDREVLESREGWREEPSASEVVESLERPSQKEFQRRAAVPRAAGFNIGPRPFAKPIPKGK